MHDFSRFALLGSPVTIKDLVLIRPFSLKGRKSTTLRSRCFFKAAHEGRFNEAQSVVLLVKNPTFRTTTTFSLWLLQQLFLPITLHDHEDIRFLHISDKVSSISLHEKNPATIKDPALYENDYNLDDAIDSPTTPPPPSNACILTPRSRIVTVAEEYSFVFMVDLSSSLATIDVDKGAIMMGSNYTIIKNIIQGLVQPMQIDTPVKEHQHFLPSIRITVIVECSQFGSNMNVVPILAEYPTMRVLLQDAFVSSKNINQVLETLNSGIDQFQRDLVSFRQRLSKRRSRLGYELDVRNDHSGMMDHDVDDEFVDISPPAYEEKGDDKKKQRTSTTKNEPISKAAVSNNNKAPNNDNNNNSRYRQRVKSRTSTIKKDVWGVGKSGSSLSYILHAGSYALSLLPPSGHSSLIIVTDGVVNSSLQDESIVRQLSNEGVECSIVQVGFGNGLSPASNFGFFPDTEILRFIASATGGHYMHAEDCPDLNSMNTTTTTTTMTDTDNGTTTILANTYQKRFLIQHITLHRPANVERPRSWINNTSLPTAPTSAEYIDTRRLFMDGLATPQVGPFPWDPRAESRPIDTHLLRYQEYSLPPSVRQVVAARTRQGFYISSVALDRSRARRAIHTAAAAADFGGFSYTKERLLITLTLEWQPDFTIEYRIRSGLSLNWSSYLSNLTAQCPENDLLDSVSNPRAEILIRTTTTFSHMLQNWDAFQRRCQVMGIVTGGIGVGDVSGSSTGFLKIGRLKKFLARIFETDQHLYALLTTRRRNNGDDHDDFRTVWEKLDQSDYRLQTSCWYDVHGFDLVLFPHHPHPLSSLEPIHHVLQKMNDVLQHWADFVSGDGDGGVHVRLMDDDGVTAFAARSKCISFCEVRLLQENARVVHVRLHFFNLRTSIRHKIIHELKEILCKPDPADMYLADLAIKDPHAAGAASWEYLEQIRVVMRPLSILLMRDPEHYFFTSTDKDHQLAEFIRPVGWGRGEFIVGNYMRRHTCYWDTSLPGTEYLANNGLTSLRQIGFDKLCNARAAQGYALISSRDGACHFYKEFKHGSAVFSSQYFVWREGHKGMLTTELWTEPVTHDRLDVQIDLYAGDKDIVTKLMTFDWTFALSHEPAAATSAFESIREQGLDDTLLTKYHIKHTMLYDISSIMESAPFSLVLYPFPGFAYGGDYNATQQVAWLEADKDVTTTTTTTPKEAISTHEPRISNTRGGGESSHHHHHYRNAAVCVCPRPDKLFLDCRDVIASLSPAHMDMTLLHYFFVQIMSVFADYELPVGSKTTSEGLDVMQILMRHDSKAIEESTLHLSRDIRGTQCFIKTFGPSTFVVICMASLDTFINRFKGDQDTTSSSTFRRMGLAMFECHRSLAGLHMHDDESGGGETTTTTMDNNTTTTTEQQHPTITTKSYEDVLVNGVGSAIRPWLSSGGRASNENEEGLVSDYRLRLIQNISDIYSRAFTKSVYTSLLYGNAVKNDDLEKVLEVCEETVLETDLTGYLNVQSLLKRRGRSNFEEIQLARQRFNTVLAHYFEPVMTENMRNLYCYRPPHAKNDASKRSMYLADIAVCAHSPLLLRLEYVLRDRKRREMAFPLVDLPYSYQGVSPSNNQEFNFEPDLIGTTTSPVASMDGTSATLRLICMTLPETMYDPVNVLSSHLKGCPAEHTAVHNQTSLLASGKRDSEALSALPEEKRNALLETKTRIMWLLTEEIMHGLLRAGPVSEPVVRYIESQLMKKNPFVDFPTTITIPLSFVKNQNQSRRVFLEQLEHNTTSLYRLVRVGNCFYASDNGFFSANYDAITGGDDPIGVIDSYDEGLGISTYNPDENVEEEKAGHDEFCEGLGISIFEPAFGDDDDDDDDDTVEKKKEEEDLEEQSTSQQLYWLLIIPQAHTVQVYFYSKMPQSVNRTEIIRVTKTMINDIMERTNKLVLLYHMNDTRICSKYLIAADEETMRYSSDTSDDDDEDEHHSSSGDNLVEILSTSGEDTSYAPPKKFHPGQFGCEILYTYRYPLHWRLQPNAALNMLATDVLRHFAVKNRPNTFVCMRDDCVVYLTLRESIYTQYTDSETQTLDDTRASSPYGSSSLFTPNDTIAFSHTRGQSSNGNPSNNSQRTSPKAAAATSSPIQSPNARKAPRPSDARELVLEVHGVDLPGWISEELVNLLENRLTAHITLKEVQQFLLRNPNSKLSRADVDFMLPVEKPPALRTLLPLSNSVLGTTEFLHMLRENIIAAGTLRVLSGNSVPSTLRRHRMMHYARKEDPTSDVTLGDLCFYYNCINRGPGVCSDLEMSVGQGAAGIALLLVDAEMVQEATTSSGSSESPMPSDVEIFVESSFGDMNKTQQYLAVDIWTIGQLEAQQLQNHLFGIFRQSICDYAIERSLVDAMFNSVGQEVIDDVVATLMQVLQKAQEWNNPSVNTVTQQLELQPWCVINIIQQLHVEFAELNLDLKPFVSRDDKYQTYTPPSLRTTTAHHSSSLQENRHYLIISGLNDLFSSSREDDVASYLETPAAARMDTRSIHSHHDSITSSIGKSQDNHHRRYFSIMFLDADGFKLYTYNYTKPFLEQAVQRITRTIEQQDARIRMLNNILHQKMGLFHHSEQKELEQQKPELYTAARLTNYNNVLRDAYTEPVHHPDHLIRHGDPFLESYLRGTQLQAAHEKAFKVYSKWATRYSSITSSSQNTEMMTVAELKLILKASRLLHFCRTPLIFSEANSFDAASHITSIFGEHDLRNEKTTLWYEHLARSFMNEYASYLESAGMHLIVNGVSCQENPEELETYLSSFRIADDYLVSSPVVYLMQVFPGGTIMCEAQLTDNFVSVTLYTLHRRYGRLTRAPYGYEQKNDEVHRASFQEFTEECDRFKQKIHVNSFVYDFHLRFIQRSLDDVDAIPDTLHLLNVIKNILSVYHKPPGYARNRVVTGTYEATLDEQVDQLVPSMLRDATKYGFRPLYFDGKPIACFVSSDDVSFHQASTNNAIFRHTLIVTPLAMNDRESNPSSSRHHLHRSGATTSEQQHHHPHGYVGLQYFVLVTYRGWPTTPRYRPDMLEEVLQPASYTLGYVVQRAKTRIDRLIKHVIYALHQDAAWNTLYQAINNTERSDPPDTLIRLATQFHDLDVIATEPPFQQFTQLDLRWIDLFDMLRLFYPMTSGYIEKATSKQLLLFNPNAVLNYFVRFELDLNTKRITITASSKEQRRHVARLDDTEMVFIGNLALTLSYCMWKLSL